MSAHTPRHNTVYITGDWFCSVLLLQHEQYNPPQRNLCGFFFQKTNKSKKEIVKDDYCLSRNQVLCPHDMFTFYLLYTLVS